MKILLIQNRFYPSLGGAEKHTYLLSKYLYDKGHDVVIYTTTSLSKEDVVSLVFTPPFIFKSKIKTHLPKNDIINGAFIRRFNMQFRFWSFNWIPEMFKELKKNTQEFDVIHAHGYHISTSLAGCYYANKFKKPFILTAHDLIIPTNLSSDAKLFKKVYDKTFGRYLLKNSKRLIALTEDHIQQYNERGGDINKIKIVPNGIELDGYKNININKNAIDKFGINDQNKILLFVGRIEKYKGIQDIIEIMPEILKEFPKGKFVIVGKDYGYKKELEKIVGNQNLKDKAIFAGNVSDDGLIGLYKRADIFVLPSKMEGFGIVLLEAMASGTLCIAYSIPAVRKIIKNKENGVLVNDKSELLERILYYLKNPDEKAKIERNALEYVENYDIKNIVNAIEGAYTEAINENMLSR
ncbi:MAG: glycosyltransferase family 4 protein [Candidatus Methanoperedens sp.]|nr:glycosyltransferase family 4 protein [Candidatus Methanoperedens sp.]